MILGLEGWKFERISDPPFNKIRVTAPNGYATTVVSWESNPSNIIYMLADDLIRYREKMDAIDVRLAEQLLGVQAGGKTKDGISYLIIGEEQDPET